LGARFTPQAVEYIEGVTVQNANRIAESVASQIRSCKTAADAVELKKRLGGVPATIALIRADDAHLNQVVEAFSDLTERRMPPSCVIGDWRCRWFEASEHFDPRDTFQSSVAAVFERLRCVCEPGRGWRRTVNTEIEALQARQQGAATRAADERALFATSTEG
jgi:hypothetical protein